MADWLILEKFTPNTMEHKYHQNKVPDPAPLLPRLLQRSKALNNTLSAGASHCKFHRHNRNTHNDQKQQIKVFLFPTLLSPLICINNTLFYYILWAVARGKRHFCSHFCSPFCSISAINISFCSVTLPQVFRVIGTYSTVPQPKST